MNEESQPFFPNPMESLFVVNSTICNLRCIFCAYSNSTIQKQIMSFADFTTILDKATQFGFDTFNLTPHIGEALTDPEFCDKLLSMDLHPGVFDYYFSTNFTLANDRFLQTIAQLKKLRWLSITVYGHDELSFVHITRSDSSWHKKLIENLEKLNEYNAIFPKAEIKIRTSGSFDLNRCDSKVCEIVRQLQDRGVRVRIPKVFHDWSGLVDQKMLKNQTLEIKKKNTEKREPCVHLFFKHTILPDGSVNACGASDGNADFIIGNAKQQEFREIYSPTNELYLRLIRSHLERRFPDTCKKCTAYRGISQSWYSYKFHRKKQVTMPMFFKWLQQNRFK